MSTATLTIINDHNLRGVIAPAADVSPECLADIVDMIEWSTPESIRETEALIAEANRDNSWIPMEEVERRLRERMVSTE